MQTLQLSSVNLEAYRSGSPDDRAQLQRELQRACREEGFFALTGHGVSHALVEQVLGAGERFFALPEPARLLSAAAGGQHLTDVRGYVQQEFGDENPFHEGALPDLNEIFQIGRASEDIPLAELHPSLRAAPLVENVWPEAVPEMRSAASAYYEVMDALAQAVYGMLRDVADFDTPAFGDHCSELIYNHYPPTSAPPENQWRIAEHMDYCLLTLLRTPLSEGRDAAPYAGGGLEVFHRARGWCRPVYDPDAFVVNLGHTLQMVSDGAWHSARHRVSVRRGEDPRGASRLSVSLQCHAEHPVAERTHSAYRALQVKSQR